MQLLEATERKVIFIVMNGIKDQNNVNMFVGCLNKNVMKDLVNQKAPSTFAQSFACCLMTVQYRSLNHEYQSSKENYHP